ncbi:DUF3566 domain-containing protein [Mycobacterium nebraskense]|uniref:DUF3566 domain-containing protein n=2 Tax=Mycobacterium nebraskense TaxID=244292 RepID=A0A1X1Z864_9MYCO|nr:DUF3566 domain-containing protein [Mycobacterium nebraskense]KLO42996.1 hypothetical protein ABW17_10610 [Mycobacterium nebraskense]MBI2696998.1 DUF3566 domain-containing protein [Mycobacterium nebraskense]MCV7115950.1 DUF3566 domain-containing protein [Mycobacterium nebraskense]ORW19390.1 hypothetical protein AWC17_08875 [Mycobacterium nebraskense]
MSSPNEPGAPKKGDGLNGDGSAERAGIHRATPPAQAGRAPEAGDPPPWQRGGPRPPQAPQRQGEPPTEARPSGPPTGVEARLNRFSSGTAAPGAGAPPPSKNPPHDAEAPPGRGDGPPAEAYASELPDLSGPMPRGPQRKAPPDRASEASSLPGSARSSSSEGREGRENRENHTQVSRRPRGPVRASMQIRRIDPWSTLKVSLLLSVALFFVWMIAVAFLYLVLGGMGVWSKLNSNVGDLLNNTSGSSGELVSSGTIFGGAVLIGLVNIVLLTAMATIAAFVYNLTTDLIGGIEVTLADRD